MQTSSTTRWCRFFGHYDELDEARNPPGVAAQQLERCKVDEGMDFVGAKSIHDRSDLGRQSSQLIWRLTESQCVLDQPRFGVTRKIRPRKRFLKGCEHGAQRAGVRDGGVLRHLAQGLLDTPLRRNQTKSEVFGQGVQRA